MDSSWKVRHHVPEAFGSGARQRRGWLPPCRACTQVGEPCQVDRDLYQLSIVHPLSGDGLHLPVAGGKALPACPHVGTRPIISRKQELQERGAGRDPWSGPAQPSPCADAGCALPNHPGRLPEYKEPDLWRRKQDESTAYSYHPQRALVSVQNECFQRRGPCGRRETGEGCSITRRLCS